MNSYDFNDADTQRNFDVIPDGTIATVRMTVRPGSAGEGGWLRRSKDGDSEALDCEFVVLDGPFAKRKFWTLLHHRRHHRRSRRSRRIFQPAKLRAILESARGIKPDDTSDAAKQARRIGSYGDLNGLQLHRAHRRRAAAERIQGEEHARSRGHARPRRLGIR